MLPLHCLRRSATNQVFQKNHSAIKSTWNYNTLLVNNNNLWMISPGSRCLSSDESIVNDPKCRCKKQTFDMVVVGGGIVGAASARELLLRHHNLRLCLVEKEKVLASHQSGHNSGVVHAGIYYKPGTLKAKLCVKGLKMAYNYFHCKNIPHKRVGKLIVATDAAQAAQLDQLHARSIENKVPGVVMLNGEAEIRQVEPYCRGVKALWSPETGIVDWAQVTQYFGLDVVQRGGKIKYNFEVVKFEESEDVEHPVRLIARNGSTVLAKYILTCTGLQSDYISQITGASQDPQIVPFRGDYLVLNPDKCHMIKGNIYPVPDPRFPFLGVHFTPRMDGSVWLGPSAILAFSREGYRFIDVNVGELMGTLMYPGFRRFASKFFAFGMKEMLKTAVTSMQVKELQKFVPELQPSDVRRGPAGVRAQALSLEGELVEDFHFDTGSGPMGKRILHCRNAPSPGATSSLAIARMVADKLNDEFHLQRFK